MIFPIQAPEKREKHKIVAGKTAESKQELLAKIVCTREGQMTSTDKGRDLRSREGAADLAGTKIGQFAWPKRQ